MMTPDEFDQKRKEKIQAKYYQSLTKIHDLMERGLTTFDLNNNYIDPINVSDISDSLNNSGWYTDIYTKDVTRGNYEVRWTENHTFLCISRDPFVTEHTPAKKSWFERLFK